MKAKSTTPKKKTAADRKPGREGVGARGSKTRPRVDEGPKWRGGGTKGENEQTSR